MKITIECGPKEIAAVVVELQKQPVQNKLQACPQCSQLHLLADVCPFCGFDYSSKQT